jgi:hypothetical protein
MLSDLRVRIESTAIRLIMAERSAIGGGGECRRRAL